MVPYLSSAPVTKHFGATLACETLGPHDFTPRRSAVSTTIRGLSTCTAMTSQLASTSEFVASASRTGSDQSPVKIRLTVALGLTRRAPARKLLMLRSTRGIGFAATKPSLPDLVHRPAATPSM